MRSSKSRSRSKANRPRSLGNIINRVFDSSGPEGKVRGTPQQIIEKYLFLARDAQLSNDRVAAENFLQHAEHYTRLLGEAQRELAAEQEARQQQFQQNGQNRDQSRDRDRRDGEPRDNGRYEAPRTDYAPVDDVQPVASAVDVIDFSGDEDAGLVDTPETLGAPEPDPVPEAAEAAQAPAEDAAPRGDRPRRPRGPRKPRAPQGAPEGKAEAAEQA